MPHCRHVKGQILSLLLILGQWSEGKKEGYGEHRKAPKDGDKAKEPESGEFYTGRCKTWHKRRFHWLFKMIQGIG